MLKQTFEIIRPPEAKPIKLETLKSLVRNIRPDAEWEIKELIDEKAFVACTIHNCVCHNVPPSAVIYWKLKDKV